MLNEAKNNLRPRPSWFRRVGCTIHQEPGDSKGVLALEDPFGRAEGVAHSWMD